MTSHDMAVELSAGEAGSEVFLSWTIDHMAPGPEGRYLLFDTAGKPRLIVDGNELGEFTDKGLGKA